MNEKSITGVIVDAGHGGIDSGAVGNGLQEKDLNLEAAQYMYDRLQELGIPAVMTRTDDEYLPKAQRIERVLEAFNNSPNTILVSNHINAGGGEGAEIVYALRNDDTLANLALNNIGEAGQIKRKIYQRRLPENPNLDYYYILRETGNTEPILVEYGFIDNAKDAQKLQSNLTNYVEGVVKAIAEYTNTPYTPPGTTGNYYTVKKGDTLYSIAARYNTSVDELKRLNNLTSNTLQIGQTLLISGSPEQTLTTYKVQKGDTLYAIAAKYNTTVDTIKQLNNLQNNTLLIGQELLIPSGLGDVENEDTGTDGEIEEGNYTTYEVVKGDSLWLIARRYGITVDELIKLNNLNTIDLQIGDILKVPNIQFNNTYTVKSGDTLWSIAKANNITVDALKQANNLTSNLLSVGQVLTIPN